MKKKFTAIFVLAFLAANVFAQTPKYIFYFIGDGMGAYHTYVTDQFNKATGRDALNFTSFPVKSLISTYSANSLITDSAAAGTALSSGTKINSNWLGMSPDGTGTVSAWEIAKNNGFGTAVVTTVGVNHATPAAFYGHAKDRNFFDELARQLIDSKLDFAAGCCFLHQRKSELYSKDWEAKAEQAGIKVFHGRNEYKPVKGSRVIYLSDQKFGDSLPYAIDRQEGDPELADFTGAAIDYLYTNFKKGFVLMVEGGKIDYAAHATDAATMIHEVNDMAKSVQLALDFAAKHPNETLILVTADHETSGLSIGTGRYEWHPDAIQYQKCSKDVLSMKIAQLKHATEGIVSWPQVKDLLRNELGLWDKIPVDSRSEKRFTQLYKEIFLDSDNSRESNLYSQNDRLAVEAIRYVDENAAMLHWASGSHSGAPVMLWCYGAKAEAFGTCADNTDVPKTIIKVAKFK